MAGVEEGLVVMVAKAVVMAVAETMGQTLTASTEQVAEQVVMVETRNLAATVFAC